MSEYKLYRVLRNAEGKHVGNEYMGNLVTCKECQHWLGESEMYEDREYRKCYNFGGFYTAPDNFCSYGEREGE